MTCLFRLGKKACINNRMVCFFEVSTIFFMFTIKYTNLIIVQDHFVHHSVVPKSENFKIRWAQTFVMLLRCLFLTMRQNCNFYLLITPTYLHSRKTVRFRYWKGQYFLSQKVLRGNTCPIRTPPQYESSNPLGSTKSYAKLYLNWGKFSPLLNNRISNTLLVHFAHTKHYEFLTYPININT